MEEGAHEQASLFRVAVEAEGEGEEMPRPLFPSQILTAQDAHYQEREEAERGSHALFFSGNPAVEVIKGRLHLFRELQGETAKVSDLLVLLAVPLHMSSSELCSFLAPAQGVLLARVLRCASSPSYMVALRMQSPGLARGFVSRFNGARFNDLAPERCKVVYVSAVEMLEPSADHVLLPRDAGLVELPTCPVCLERLEQRVSGVIITVCNHSFHCRCLAQWDSDSTCPVCRYTAWDSQHAPSSTRCSRCGASEDLWICLICGNVGCCRYEAGHAVSHYKETGHTYSLELDTQRVWDYAGEGYVHRLLQAGDGKVVELPAPLQHTDFRAPPDKLQKIVTEYNYLLTSQLEAQREYYEGLLNKARARPKGSRQAAHLKERVADLERDNYLLLEVNKQHAEARKEAQRKQADYERQLAEMREQLQDVMFALEAQRVQRDEGDALEDGQVVTVASPKPPAQQQQPQRRRSNKKKKKKK